MSLKNKKYTSAVKEARQLLLVREKAKLKIAKLAYESCDIIVGGHITGEVFSLTMFAKDIGMSKKTLSDWVHNYEIQLVAKGLKKKNKNLEVPTKQNDLNKIRKVLRSKEGGLRKNITEKEVHKAIKEVASTGEDDEEIAKLARYIRQTEYKICHDLELETIDQEKLSLILECATRINSKLKKYFTIYERPKVTIRTQDPQARKSRVRTLRLVEKSA